MKKGSYFPIKQKQKFYFELIQIMFANKRGNQLILNSNFVNSFSLLTYNGLTTSLG